MLETGITNKLVVGVIRANATWGNAEMAYATPQMNPEAIIQQALLDKHFLRRHGQNAYYGRGGR